LAASACPSMQWA
jgi:hypothetical protein